LLRNNGAQIWATDFLHLHDACSAPTLAFSIIPHDRHRVMHVGVTHHTSAAWIAQQVRQATPWGEAPHFLILGEGHLRGLRGEYVGYYHRRPHQGLERRPPLSR
jgi:hypothetical protein